jgi:hypothetical protein
VAAAPNGGRGVKVVYYVSEGKPREIMLAKALAEGCKQHKDELEIRYTADYGETPDGSDRRWPGPMRGDDVACFFGVKGRSRQIFDDHRRMGKATLYFDKGLTREKGDEADVGHTKFSRIYVNDVHPASYMMSHKRGDKRWSKIKRYTYKHRPYPGGHVLICSSSQKYHDFHGLGNKEEYAQGLISQITKLTKRHLIYRPKPSSHEEVPEIVRVGGASFSSRASNIDAALKGCHVVVTHGATAAMDAIMAGVPAICLGKCVTTPVAGDMLAQVEAPEFPGDDLRQKWLNAMAYCQWTREELQSGEAWEDLKAEIEKQGGK